LSEAELAWLAAGDALATEAPDEVELVVAEGPSSRARHPFWIAASAGVAVMGALCFGLLARRAEERPAVAAALAPAAPPQPALPRPRDAMSEPRATPTRERVDRPRPARKGSPGPTRHDVHAAGRPLPAAPGPQRRPHTPHAPSAGLVLRR
jgi:hypothetical protein